MRLQGCGFVDMAIFIGARVVSPQHKAISVSAVEQAAVEQPIVVKTTLILRASDPCSGPFLGGIGSVEIFRAKGLVFKAAAQLEFARFKRQA